MTLKKIIKFFPKFHWLSWNSKFDSWFGWHALSCSFYMVGTKCSLYFIRNNYIRGLLKIIKYVSYIYRILNGYISIGKWWRITSWGFVSYFCVDSGIILLRWNFKEEYSSQWNALFIHFFQTGVKVKIMRKDYFRKTKIFSKLGSEAET